MSCPEKTSGARLIPRPAGITAAAPCGAARPLPSWWIPRSLPSSPAEPHYPHRHSMAGRPTPTVRPRPPAPPSRAHSPSHPSVSVVSSYGGLRAGTGRTLRKTPFIFTPQEPPPRMLSFHPPSACYAVRRTAGGPGSASANIAPGGPCRRKSEGLPGKDRASSASHSPWGDRAAGWETITGSRGCLPSPAHEASFFLTRRAGAL